MKTSEWNEVALRKAAFADVSKASNCDDSSLWGRR